MKLTKAVLAEVCSIVFSFPNSIHVQEPQQTLIFLEQTDTPTKVKRWVKREAERTLGSLNALEAA